MSNFQFLLPDFKPLYKPAKGAEQLAQCDLCEVFAKDRANDERVA